MSPAEIIEQIIRERKTEKVLGDVDSTTTVPEELAARNHTIILQAIESAGWAPYHYPRNVDELTEPWRAHVLWDDDTKQAARYLRDDLGVTSKEPSLAAGCHALVLVTWLPEFYDERAQGDTQVPREKQIARDEEHLAAASAMVQNLLLLLTAHGMGTYWSSGGKFRGPEMFEYLGIPANERLLAAVFIEYPELVDETKARKPGALRETRGTGWIREVELNS